MLQYIVRYEIEARPSDVIVEIYCKNKEEADEIYEERLKHRTTFLRVRILEREI
jgi:hypothetical protein